MDVLPIPDLPPRPSGSPPLVLMMDRIRHALDDAEHAEFYWFAREYPRIYRHHIDHAWHRLERIHGAYQRLLPGLEARIKGPGEIFSASVSNLDVQRIYWDFEAYLNAVGSALDVVARVVGPSFEQHTPASFNRFKTKAPESRLKEIFSAASRRWVNRMKDYRDCFVHYTPPDTLLMLHLHKYANGWELRAPIPKNPNAREILGFRWGRPYHVLKYAATTWRHLLALDRAVTSEIHRLFLRERFPIRSNNLFFVGRRSR